MDPVVSRSVLLRLSAVAWLALVLTAAVCGENLPSRPDGPDRPDRPDVPDPPRDSQPRGPSALSDVPAFTYLGLPSGLYPGGTNEPPARHAADGRAALALIQPLDLEGQPDPDGRIVLVSVGMSNASQEFCSNSGRPPCHVWSFMGLAEASPLVEKERLTIVNGAAGGQTAETWDEAGDNNYERVRRDWLSPQFLSENQVQIAWVKQASADPQVPLPGPNADAYQLEAGLGQMVRAMKERWPNLRIVFFSSRTYGGYATVTLNPEPFAYESAFAVRGVIAAQIDQGVAGVIDPQAGDVGIAGGAPWLAWGPYLWADGPYPRADGLVWLRTDFQADGVHPSPDGEEKVAALLFDFFTTSPYAQCWFLAGRSCQN
jgi:hypothetical protein